MEQSLLADLSAAARARLLAHAREVRIPAGQWLFRGGDPADALFVVQAGRIDVVDESTATPLRVLGPGAALGEIGLLTGLPRTASARARRDSRVLRLDADVLDVVLREFPDLALALTRATALRVARPGGPAAARSATTVVAVVPLDGGAGVAGVREALQGSLAGSGAPARAAVLVPGDAPEDGETWARLLDDAERAAEVVVLLTEPLRSAAERGWTDFCLRSADRAVVLVAPGDDVGRAGPLLDRLRRHLAGPADLCFLDAPTTSHVRAWLEAQPHRAHHLVRTTPPTATADDVGRMTRRVLQRAVGIVLSGGGARGFAHLGVVAALEEAGITVDRVGGCSMGAIMGAIVAAGHAPDARVEIARRYFVTNRPLGDYTVPRTALLRGERMRTLMREAFGSASVELLPRPFFCISADLMTAEPVVHRQGELWQALVASASIPGLLPPVALDGRLLVDGGVLDNLPIAVMADDDEGPVIAVDVMRPFTSPEPRGRRRPGWLARRRADPGEEEVSLPIAEVLMRTTVLGSWRTIELNRHRAALTVTLPEDDTGLLQWDRLDALVEAGRRAAESALSDPAAAAVLPAGAPQA